VTGLAKIGACVWNFGNVSGTTFRNFGKTGQYGKPDVARYAGSLASPVKDNPSVRQGL
jgi:hypothetical protein